MHSLCLIGGQIKKTPPANSVSQIASRKSFKTTNDGVSTSSQC